MLQHPQGEYYVERLEFLGYCGFVHNLGLLKDRGFSARFKGQMCFRTDNVECITWMLLSGPLPVGMHISLKC